MDSQEPKPVTARLTLPNSVGHSLLADDDIVSFLSRQSSNSLISEDLEPSKASHHVPGPVGSCVMNDIANTSENDSVQADEVKFMDAGHVQAGTNRMAWTTDIVAITVASASLVSIYVVLGTLDNKEQPQWPLPATLNLGALIALLATILRSMLMEVVESVISQLKWRWFKSTRPLSHFEAYDEASRGPWGAARFIPLFRLNWATWGALVSVLSIAISTLTQQAFRTSACSRPISHGDALIPIAQTCPEGTRQTLSGYSNTTSYFLDPRLKAALISGLAGVQSARPLNPTCSSGNCTFLPLNGITYSSVVISTDCIDVSPHVNQSGALDWLSSADMATATYYNSPFGMNLSYSNVWRKMLSTATLEHDFYDNFGLDLKLSENQKTSASRSWAVVGMMMPTANPCEDASAYQWYIKDDPRASLQTLPPVKTSSCPQLDLPKVTTLPGYFSVNAAICWFYPTLQHFTGFIQQGSFQEQAIGDPIPLLDEGFLVTPTKPIPAKLACSLFSDPCIIQGSFYVPDNFSDAPGGLATVYYDKFNVTGPLRCLYGLDPTWFDAIVTSDNLTHLSYAFSHAFSPIDPLDCVPAANYTEMLCADKWWLGNMYNGGNASRDSIFKVLNRGFSSMSDQMRMMGTDWSGNPSNVSGTAYHTAICIEFDWEWLFFPLVLVLATLLLLVAVMFDTRGELVWKSSILPLLFYGLEERKTVRGPRLQAEKELHATAKTTMVDFSFARSTGWRFRGATGTR